MPSLKSLPLAVGLFVVWVILSGKLDGFHLGIGALTALLVARLGEDVLSEPPAVGRSLSEPFGGIDWWRALTFVPWLAWQIALSSIQVARVVFDPRLPVQPGIVRVETKLPHTLARLTLAHSITLTPGTVTLDVDGDDLIVHTLTKAGAEDIRRGTMTTAVRPVFDATVETQTPS